MGTSEMSAFLEHFRHIKARDDDDIEIREIARMTVAAETQLLDLREMERRDHVPEDESLQVGPEEGYPRTQKFALDVLSDFGYQGINYSANSGGLVGQLIAIALFRGGTDTAKPPDQVLDVHEREPISADLILRASIDHGFHFGRPDAGV